MPRALRTSLVLLGFALGLLGGCAATLGIDGVPDVSDLSDASGSSDASDAVAQLAEGAVPGREEAGACAFAVAGRQIACGSLTCIPGDNPVCCITAPSPTCVASYARDCESQPVIACQGATNCNGKGGHCCLFAAGALTEAGCAYEAGSPGSDPQILCSGDIPRDGGCGETPEVCGSDEDCANGRACRMLHLLAKSGARELGICAPR